MRTGILVFTTLLLQACAMSSQTRLPDHAFYATQLQSIVDSTSAAGATLVIDAPRSNNDRAVAVGRASPGLPLTVMHPVRIASVTKTYVAAAVLRLWEQGEVGLNKSIDIYLSDSTKSSLLAAGHDPSDILVRHLLSHTAGLPDHADEAYLLQIVQNPDKAWSRAEQIALLSSGREPVGTPGAQFVYSDTGYVLLGELIERQTGKTLATAVRELLRLNRLGLTTTWWDVYERGPAEALPRATQVFEGYDITQWSGTIDLYGGGGIVASTEDMMRFYAALFSGQVFERADTLEVMVSANGEFPSGSPYRFGLFESDVDGILVYEHGGFWGTHVLHAPSLETTISGVVLDKDGYDELVAVMRSALTALAP